VTDSCEHGNEPSGSIKCKGFLDKLNLILASQEGLCSMELANIFHSIRAYILKNTYI
jgi:hypothetical protein